VLKRFHAKSTAAPIAAGIALVPVAKRIDPEAPSFGEVLAAAFVALGTVERVALLELRHTWRRHPGVGSTHFEAGQHQPGRPEPVVASRLSLRRSRFGCRPEEQQLPWRLECSGHHRCDDVQVSRRKRKD
jgi:hypothetical protein